MRMIGRELPSGSNERKGLLFTSIEEVSMTTTTRIHDAEGVAVTVGDEIEMVVQSEPTGGPAQESRTFGRVLEVRTEATVHKPAAVIVGWNHNQRVGEIAPVVFENFCRILDVRPRFRRRRADAGVRCRRIDVVDRTGNPINVDDDVRYILHGAPYPGEANLLGRVSDSKDGSLLVQWSDGSKSIVTAADVRSKIVLVKSRS